MIRIREHGRPQATGLCIRQLTVPLVLLLCCSLKRVAGPIEPCRSRVTWKYSGQTLYAHDLAHVRPVLLVSAYRAPSGTYVEDHRVYSTWKRTGYLYIYILLRVLDSHVRLYFCFPTRVASVCIQYAWKDSYPAHLLQSYSLQDRASVLVCIRL